MEIQLVENFDDSSVIKSIDDLIKQFKEAEKAGDGFSAGVKDALDEAGVSMEEFNTALDSYTTKTVKAQKVTEDNAKSVNKYGDLLGQTVGEMQIFGISLNDIKDRLGRLKEGLTQATSGTDAAGKGFARFNNALKVSVIGLIITAVGALINYLSKFQPVIDLTTKVTAAASAAFNELGKRLASLGSVFSNFFSGNFSEAFTELKGTVSGLGDAMADAAKAAFALEERAHKLRDAIIDSTVQLAKQRNELERLKFAGEDDTLTFKQRSAAIREAQSVAQSYYATRIQLAEEALAIQKLEQAQQNDNADARQKTAELEISLYELREEKQHTDLELQKEKRGVQKDAADAAKTQQEAEIKRLADINKLVEQYNALRSEILRAAQRGDIAGKGEIAQLVLEYQLAIEDLAKAELEAVQKAAAAGVDFDLSPAFERIRKGIEVELEANLKTLQGGDIAPLPNLLTIQPEIKLKPLVKEVDLTDLEKLTIFRNEILKKLGIDKDGLSELNAAFAGAFDASIGAITDLQDAALIKIDAVISKLDEQIEKQSEVVSEQQALAEQGLANDLDIEQRKLAGLEQEREKAAAKRLVFERRQAALQLAVDSAQQISSLATAGANVLKAQSNQGLVGILFAVTAIAAMFSIFAKAKANAAQFAAPPKFKKGGQIDGLPHEQGGTIIEAERGEFVVHREATQKHKGLLEILNEQGSHKTDYKLTAIGQNAEFETIGGAGASRDISLADATNMIVEAVTSRYIYPYKGGYIEKVKRGNVVEINKNFAE